MLKFKSQHKHKIKRSKKNMYLTRHISINIKVLKLLKNGVHTF